LFAKENYLFERYGAKVYGICQDSTELHDEFSCAFWVPFPLLSDTDCAVGNMYERGKDFNILPGRTTFVIDKAGIIRLRYSSATNVAAHVKKAMKKVKQISEGGTDL